VVGPSVLNARDKTMNLKQIGGTPRIEGNVIADDANRNAIVREAK
jgi:hypothetical protein